MNGHNDIILSLQPLHEAQQASSRRLDGLIDKLNAVTLRLSAIESQMDNEAWAVWNARTDINGDFTECGKLWERIEELERNERELMKQRENLELALKLARKRIKTLTDMVDVLGDFDELPY